MGINRPEKLRLLSHEMLTSNTKVVKRSPQAISRRDFTRQHVKSCDIKIIAGVDTGCRKSEVSKI